jgi:hypothetical protein
VAAALGKNFLATCLLARRLLKSMSVACDFPHSPFTPNNRDPFL